MTTMRGARLFAVAFVIALATSFFAVAPASSQPSSTIWLCRPGLANNPCTPDLTTTVYNGQGHATTTQLPSTNNTPIDCFYVYPTVSNQPTPEANFNIDPELRSIALYQAARYSSECRVFAPVYRQITLAGIFGGATAAMRETAYQDVRSAWLDYLEHDNDGRGVVFIGHSQGAGVLRRLLREEVDPNPSVRARLVSAILLGGNVTVANGSDRGGDFQNIPACTSPQQVGCVLAWSTFDAPVPPNSLFGRTATPGQHVLCTNPAALTSNNGKVDVITPTAPFAPGAIASVTALVGQPPITATTPFVEYRGAYRAACSSANNANVLQVAPFGASPVLHPEPDATWGLHLVDANIALGNLIDLVHQQAQHFTH